MTRAAGSRGRTSPSRSIASKRSSATSRTTGSACTAWPPRSRPTPRTPTTPSSARSRGCAPSASRGSAAAPPPPAGIRLSPHPGQYTVLNSTDERVAALAAEELEVQAEILDGMGLGPEAIVVLHVGGAAGGTPTALDRFARGFERLSEAARNRLVIENDDRAFGLADVLALAERIGRPVVWDVLHHHCHDPERIPDTE